MLKEGTVILLFTKIRKKKLKHKTYEINYPRSWRCGGVGDLNTCAK